MVRAQKIGLIKKMKVPPISSWIERKPLRPNSLISRNGWRTETSQVWM